MGDWDDHDDGWGNTDDEGNIGNNGNIEEDPNYLSFSNEGLTEIPAIPNNITELELYGNKITKIPLLPPQIKILRCENCLITEIVPQPALEELYCRGNKLQTLPDMPNIKVISCSEQAANQKNPFNLPPDFATKYPKLEQLVCNNVKSKPKSFLTKGIPPLPASLELLSCSYCNLTTLPDPMPTRLEELICSNNNLTRLPTNVASLPLTTLMYNSNNLTEIPMLPTTLRSCWLINNKNLVEPYKTLVEKTFNFSYVGDTPEVIQGLVAAINTVNKISNKQQSVNEIESIVRSGIGMVLSERLPHGVYEKSISSFLYDKKGHQIGPRMNAQELMLAKANLAGVSSAAIRMGAKPEHVAAVRQRYTAKRPGSTQKRLTQHAAKMSAARMFHPRKSLSSTPPNDRSYIGNTVNAPDPSPPKYTTSRSGRKTRKTHVGGRSRSVSRR